MGKFIILSSKKLAATKAFTKINFSFYFSRNKRKRPRSPLGEGSFMARNVPHEPSMNSHII